MQTYRHFEQSEGSLCKLPNTFNGVKHEAVGTFRCRTCLCVYVEFADKSVFIAHMAALNLPEFDLSPAELMAETPEQHLASWTSGPASGEKLKEIVLRQLRSQLGEGLREQAVEGFVVCPSIGWDGERAHGRWMRDAIQEFFLSTEIKLSEGHGFVAGPGVETEFFEWDVNSSEMDPESHGWESAGQEISTMQEIAENQAMGPWAFESRNGQWRVVQERQRSEAGTLGRT